MKIISFQDKFEIDGDDKLPTQHIVQIDLRNGIQQGLSNTRFRDINYISIFTKVIQFGLHKN